MRARPESRTFSRAEARALGWTDSALHRAVVGGRLIRLRRGHYAAGPLATPELAAIAAAHAGRGNVVSHRSALLLHGIALIGPPPPVPELTVAPRGPVAVADAHVHRATLPAHHLVMVAGVATTTVARTVMDVARHHPTATAVAAIDHALHDQRTTDSEIGEVLRTCWNWPGVRRATRALALSDPRAESPLESLSRLAFRGLQLPAPRPQRTILDQFGNFVGRGDFYWDEFGVIGEADGRSKYDGRAKLTAEKDRQEEFEDLGLVVTRWGWDLATTRRYALRLKIENAFERGRRRDQSGFTRLWSVRGD